MSRVDLAPDADPAGLTPALVRGLEFLAAQQAADGSFDTLAGPDVDLERTGVSDPSPFTTAMIAWALGAVEHDLAKRIVNRAVDSLVAERLPIGAWRFWSKRNPGADFIPPDIDDTAYCAHVLVHAGIDAGVSLPLMLGNRNGRGLFYTWILPRPRHLFRPSTWGALAWILRSPRKHRRWLLSGQDPPEASVIDVVVNVNALAFLGDRPETAGVAAWIVDVVRQGTEARNDRSYQSELATWCAILRCAESGVTSLDATRPIIVDRLRDVCRGNQASRLPALHGALATILVSAWDPESPWLEDLVDSLRGAQRADGSWPAYPMYYGGYLRCRGWGAAALTTAMCIEALAQARRVLARDAAS